VSSFVTIQRISKNKVNVLPSFSSNNFLKIDVLFRIMGPIEEELIANYYPVFLSYPEISLLIFCN
jgi:hypothetical protein